jgi:hypothetical protein
MIGKKAAVMSFGMPKDSFPRIKSIVGFEWKPAALRAFIHG